VLSNLCRIISESKRARYFKSIYSVVFYSSLLFQVEPRSPLSLSLLSTYLLVASPARLVVYNVSAVHRTGGRIDRFASPEDVLAFVLDRKLDLDPSFRSAGTAMLSSSSEQSSDAIIALAYARDDAASTSTVLPVLPRWSVLSLASFLPLPPPPASSLLSALTKIPL